MTIKTTIPPAPPPALQARVRKLRWLCLILWFGLTVMPVVVASLPPVQLGPWPLSFWLAAQGALLGYLAIIAAYAWLVNRWEREAGCLSFEVPGAQDG